MSYGTQAHKKLKEKALSWLENQGYTSGKEVRIGSARIDVVGRKNGEVVGIECGYFNSITRRTMNHVLSKFDKLYFWPHNAVEPALYYRGDEIAEGND